MSKSLIFAWIVSVYALFAWNVPPHFYARYRPLIQDKIFGKNAENKTQLPANPQTVPFSNPASAAPPLHSSAPALVTSAPRSWLSIFSGNLARAAGVFLLFFILAGCGRKLLSLFQVRDSESPAALAALGLLPLAYGVLALGTFGILSVPWLWGLVLICALWSGRETFSFMRSGALALSEAFSKPKWIFAAPLLALALVLFLRTFLPDPFYDSLTYHLALPQAYLNGASTAPVLHNFNSAFPQMAEMLYTLGLGLGGDDTLPLLLQLGLGLLLAWALWNFSKKSYGLGALVWLTTPVVLENTRYCKSDLLLSLGITLAFISIAERGDFTSWKATVPGGLIMGLALGAKYTGFFFLLLVTLVLWRSGAAANLKERWRSLLVFWGCAFLLFFPWPVRNLLYYGNPLYPSLQSLFGFREMRPENWVAFLAENHQFYDGEWKFQHLFRMIWEWTLRGHEYPIMNFIGPIWLAFLPVVFLYGFRLRWNRLAMLLVGLAYLGGLTQTTLARYFFLPVLPIFALLITRSIAAVSAPAMRRALYGFLFAGVLLQSVGAMPLIEQVSFGRKALTGLEPEKEEKLYSPGYLALVQWTNTRLPEDSGVLFLGETRAHRFQRRVLAPSVHNHHPLSQWIRRAANAEELHEILKKSKITHVLVNRTELERLRGYPMFSWQPGDEKILKDFWSRHLELSWEREPYTLYALTERSSFPAIFPEKLTGL